MRFQKIKYRIDSLRWQYWNYSAPATYFLTICIQNRQEILGEIEDGMMTLSAKGKIVEKHILSIPEYNQRIFLDEWVIMPNHLHLLVTLCGYQYNNGFSTNNTSLFDLEMATQHDSFIIEIGNSKPDEKLMERYRKFRRKMLIPKIMGKFQTLTSIDMNAMEKMHGRKNWQVNYHDHVVRNEESYFSIKNYIRNNPAEWKQDRFFGEN